MAKKKDKPTPSYIGEHEVTALIHDGDETTIEFKDHDPVVLNDDLLKLCLRPVANEGSVTDVIAHVLAAKYLAELSDYGLEFYMVETITQGMRTYAHNLRETAIGKAFGGTGALDMKLNKLID